MKKYILITLLFFIISATFLPVYAQNENNNVKAKIVENGGTQEIVEENKSTRKVQNVKVRILEGEYENEEYEMIYLITEDIESITSNSELKNCSSSRRKRGRSN